MEALKICGGNPLNGEIHIQGAKNSVLPILAATLLSGGVCVIENCPDLADVHSSLRILRHLGCGARFENNALSVDATYLSRTDIPENMMREMRSSVIFLGAILARTRQVCMSYPGGCELGARPIDIHIDSLRRLGAEISEKNGNIDCRAVSMTGTEIVLPLPSVGATENIMIASCACDGVTHIKNAACEPEIEDLQSFLTAMGARVYGAGTATVTIEGGVLLHGARHRVIPDRIAAATYL
ncbi:MAG: UDP-N-acetylglucosamine 1-carboxyvinyltransferase, partial [Oscillospiraceae bacterium]|nr:UDP-N-acetylglucosamine 1-carboxyvinyltransferase [Oscillospiraceae bacterium]